MFLIILLIISDDRETSPFSSRECGNNPESAKNVNNKPATVEKVEVKPKDSDDEDDYTFDEVNIFLSML